MAKKAQQQIEPKPAANTKPPILGVNVKGELRDIDLSKVIDPQGPSDRIPRPGDAEAIDALAGSMRETGQLQPVMLEELADGRFARVFGRRRIAAARKLGWTTIRASVVTPLPDDVRRTIVAVENVQRQDLTPAEETLAVGELMELQALPAAVQLAKPLLAGPVEWHGKVVTPSMTSLAPKHLQQVRPLVLSDHRVRAIASELVAAMLGKTPQWVRDRMYIGRLDEAGRKAVLEGRLPLAHAREIAKVGDEKLRAQLAKDYAAGGSDSISDVEPGQLADLQLEVRRHVFALSTAPWNLEVGFAGRQACEGCKHNSATNPGLFEVGGEVSLNMVGGRGTYDSGDANSQRVIEKGICTLPSCYQDKLRAAKAAISTHAKRIVELEISAAKVKGQNKPAMRGGINPQSPAEMAKESLSKAKEKVPAFVKDSALRRKIEDRRNQQARSPRKVASDPKAKQRAELEEAKRNAGYKLNDAREKRVKTLESAIIDSLKTKPGARALMHLVVETGPWKRAMGNGPNARRAAQGPELQELFRLVQSPSLEGLLKIEKAGGFKFALLSPISWHLRDKELVDVLATAMGIDLGEPPTLEQFLPAKFRKAKAPAAAEAQDEDADLDDAGEAAQESDQEDSE